MPASPPAAGRTAASALRRLWIQALELLLNTEQGDSVGFNLLREMELVGEDEVDTHEDLSNQDSDAEPEQLALKEQYDSNFPAMETDAESKKWGPVQAARMSSRIADDKRTIIEKAH
ncbi:Protein TRANSPARENT TESTA 12 [Hordeum vulgare]|nr:Protein TRANSPARENT TESTA 12 [Hordeum vulgare]